MKAKRGKTAGPTTAGSVCTKYLFIFSKNRIEIILNVIWWQLNMSNSELFTFHGHYMRVTEAFFEPRPRFGDLFVQMYFWNFLTKIPLLFDR